ncbi:catalase [Chelatococcus reniformis]|nr:catalase [Chelatococcus reniformis]
MSRFGAATPAAIVDALRAVAGDPSTAGASFARGRCVRGTYAPSDHAGDITKSRSFTRPSRILARFSVGGGDANGAAAGKLRGFSFSLGADAHRSDIVAQSAPVHYARTLEQMLGFIEARRPRAGGRPDPEAIGAFCAAHPETLHQSDCIADTPPPPSYAGTVYWGVHAFPATSATGETRFIKFKIVPVGGEAGRGAEESATTAAVLLDDLAWRIAAGDVRFSVMALPGRPGDPILDVTARWPEEDDREAIRLGTLVVTGMEVECARGALPFDPATLAEGIGLPADEIFAARRACAVSPARLPIGWSQPI